ncbi:MAG: hypothetical protein AABW86_00735 [Candidatus Micrarchaeota archaeon]
MTHKTVIPSAIQSTPSNHPIKKVDGLYAELTQGPESALRRLGIPEATILLVTSKDKEEQRKGIDQLADNEKALIAIYEYHTSQYAERYVAEKLTDRIDVLTCPEALIIVIDISNDERAAIIAVERIQDAGVLKILALGEYDRDGPAVSIAATEKIISMFDNVVGRIANHILGMGQDCSVDGLLNERDELNDIVEDISRNSVHDNAKMLAERKIDEIKCVRDTPDDPLFEQLISKPPSPN